MSIPNSQFVLPAPPLFPFGSNKFVSYVCGKLAHSYFTAPQDGHMLLCPPPSSFPILPSTLLPGPHHAHRHFH